MPYSLQSPEMFAPIALAFSMNCSLWLMTRCSFQGTRQSSSRNCQRCPEPIVVSDVLVQHQDVIGGMTFDFSKPFLPEALAGVDGIECLNAEEKLKLNHIRAFTYLYLFGLVEEYILPAVIDHAGTAAHGDDYEMRALLRFAEEESKHIQLFKWFVKEFEKGFGTPCRAIGPA